MKVTYRLEALQDLDRHRAYILDRNPNAAQRIANTLRHSISRLELFPYSGRQGIILGTYELVVPKLPFFSFLEGLMV
jgi:plasmid stabilization system protein ParE